jgi:hypothetical protein
MRIDGPAAWSNALDNDFHRWDAKRFSERFVSLGWKPKFQLQKSDRFFCMGSCFARNIEEHFTYRNIKVLSQSLKCPASEWGNRPSGLVNKFTTASMQNEFDWISGRPFPDSSFLETPHGWLDLQLVPGQVPVSHERAVERRSYLIDDYFSRINQADVIVMTLGFIESWFDNRAGIYLNATPPMREVKRDPGRFQFECTAIEQNQRALNNIHDTLSRIRPNARIIITVSPVPLDVTFTGQDIIVANSHSKAILLCAARAFAAQHDNVDYFPSYEMVVQSRRESAYRDDMLHVQSQCVSKIIDTFFELYVGPTRREFPEFEEVGYLQANPDIFTAVRAGILESGYRHWIEIGRKEGRPLSVQVGAASGRS